MAEGGRLQVLRGECLSVGLSVCLYVCLSVRGQRVDDFKCSNVNVCLSVCL